jgi:hypothetical protein
MRHVRILHDGAPAEGTLDGDEVVLADGTRLREDDAQWLPPV